MSGLEAVEINISDIDLSDRYDAEYFSKEYLMIEKRLQHCQTTKMANLAKMVASAFYPAATQLYSSGDTPFIRCVDCIQYPIITKSQDNIFERIPYTFALESKGISFLNKGDIVITKVGSPCYSSLITEYDEVALSRTVMGLTKIHDINPVYLMIFLRGKYGFEQLYRQRELTIQYQLTLDRVKKLDIYLPSNTFQFKIAEIVSEHTRILAQSRAFYSSAEAILLDALGGISFATPSEMIAIKSFSESIGASGRLDAEYYQQKYDSLFTALSGLPCKKLGNLVTITKSIEPGSEYYGDDGVPFVRVSDITKYGISSTEINIPAYLTDLRPKKNTILLSKDGSVGIAYKVERDIDVITSGALLHLTVKHKDVLPDYLTLVLNSEVVRMQAERDAGGSIIQHWKPSEISEVVIPLLSHITQCTIAEKIQQSFKLRRQSEHLLEQAKRAVEIAIEDGEDTALAYLKGEGVEG